MFSKKNIILTIITLPILVIAILFVNLTPLADPTGHRDREHAECSISSDIEKSIDKNHATVKNNSEDCEYTVTLALYNSPLEPQTLGWIEAQTLIGSDTKVVKPNETQDFSVEDTGGACWKQSDLFEGSTLLTPPYYSNLLDDVYEVPCLTPTVTTEPTLTPVVTEVVTPTVTDAPTVTPTNVPGPTSTPEPGPTSTPGPEPTATPTPAPAAAAAVLASTGNAEFIYAIVIAGAVFLISGLILKKVNK